MDWISFLQNNIGEFIILIGGSGILYWRETKRGKKIDNDSKVMEEWKEMYHEKEKKCTEKDQIIKDKDDKIEQLQKRLVLYTRSALNLWQSASMNSSRKTPRFLR